MNKDDRIKPLGTASNGRPKKLRVATKGNSKKTLKKWSVIGVGSCVVLGVVVFGFEHASSAFSSDDAPISQSDINYKAGETSTAVNDNMSDFMQKQTEAEKLKKADEEAIKKKQAEQATTPPPSTPTTVTPPAQPVTTVTTTPIDESPEPPKPTAEELALARKLSGIPTFSQKSASIPELPSGNFDTSLDAPDYAPGTASVSKAGYLDFLLRHGSVIPCALYTQIISDQAGYVTCRVTQDVYSANGSALLIERGSLVSGTQKVALENGQGRIFTNWSTIDTPLGVSVKIDSLGTGALGAAGIDAFVDDHFSERFGGAILLSFVDDALATASNYYSKSDSDISFDNSSSNASDMASKALDSSINIPPTGYANIGQRINILVVRDIDMSSVYQFN